MDKISLIKESDSLIKIGDTVRSSGTEDGLKGGEGEVWADRFRHLEHAARCVRHQLVLGATGQPENDPDVVARGAVAVTIVLDA